MANMELLLSARVSAPDVGNAPLSATELKVKQFVIVPVGGDIVMGGNAVAFASGFVIPEDSAFGFDGLPGYHADVNLADHYVAAGVPGVVVHIIAWG